MGMQNESHYQGLIHLFGIVVVAASVLGYGIERAGIASLLSDPVAGIRAQDESSYISSAVHVATEGGWLTPQVLGRYVLFKPPLLIWLSGLALKVFGISHWAARLPSLTAAILATVTLFWWARSAASTVVAWSTGLVLLSDPLWHTFARLCYTDMLLTASITGAVANLCHFGKVAECRPVRKG